MLLNITSRRIQMTDHSSKEVLDYVVLITTFIVALANPETLKYTNIILIVKRVSKVTEMVNRGILSHFERRLHNFEVTSGHVSLFSFSFL